MERLFDFARRLAAVSSRSRESFESVFYDVSQAKDLFQVPLRFDAAVGPLRRLGAEVPVVFRVFSVGVRDVPGEDVLPGRGRAAAAAEQLVHGAVEGLALGEDRA